MSALSLIYNPACTRCTLYRDARYVCMPASGKGTHLRALIVGEAPGRQEDTDGIPFIGQAGRVLDKALLKVDLTREEIAVTNAVKCRPPGNRTPESDEIDACVTYLSEEITVLDARVILALGNVATQALLGLTGITSIRGTWYRLNSIVGRWVLPTYHPAYVLRKGLGSDVHKEFLSDIQDFSGRLSGRSKT